MMGWDNISHTFPNKVYHLTQDDEEMVQFGDISCTTPNKVWGLSKDNIWPNRMMFLLFPQMRCEVCQGMMEIWPDWVAFLILPQTGCSSCYTLVAQLAKDNPL